MISRQDLYKSAYWAASTVLPFYAGLHMQTANPYQSPVEYEILSGLGCLVVGAIDMHRAQDRADMINRVMVPPSLAVLSYATGSMLSMLLQDGGML